jgi:hypothetical protein
MDWNYLLNDSRLRPTTRQNDARNEFESDLGRIIFSPAIRRMHDKTQVFPLLLKRHLHTHLGKTYPAYIRLRSKSHLKIPRNKSRLATQPLNSKQFLRVLFN